jgi:hypothetical protein
MSPALDGHDRARSQRGSTLGQVFSPLSRWARVRVREEWRHRSRPLTPALSRWERGNKAPEGGREVIAGRSVAAMHRTDSPLPVHGIAAGWCGKSLLTGQQFADTAQRQIIAENPKARDRSTAHTGHLGGSTAPGRVGDVHFDGGEFHLAQGRDEGGMPR